MTKKAKSSAEQAADEIMPVLSEDEIAREFVTRNVDQIRFDCIVGAWYTWSGTQWQRDDTDIALEWTRSFVRTLAKNEGHPERRRMGSLRTARGVEGFARIDARVAWGEKARRWDSQLDAIGTPTGIVDLRTGEFCDPLPDAYITKSVAVDPDIATLCPRWLAFLNQITGNDATLKKFLQQWAGYCLTGDTIEQKLVFIHGPGGTGKTTFANILVKLMADYATAAGMGTFTDGKFDQHPEELARFDGMRLVVASETEAGHKWRESRVKNLTGGEPIIARYMRQASFQFEPQFKLTFVGNHAPAISNLDSAIRRRFLIVPFTRKPLEPDLHLEKVLLNEWPGILRWMINGAADWYASGGLIAPKAVNEATSRYFDNQDLMAHWLSECCDADPDNKALMEKSATLFKSWSEFAKSHGEAAGTQAMFNESLGHRGFEVKQIKALNTSGTYGIRVKLVSHWQDAS